jgi:hypothetical protein
LFNDKSHIISLAFFIVCCRFVFESKIHETWAKEITRKEIFLSNGPWRGVAVCFNGVVKLKNAKHQSNEKREKNLRSLCDLTVQKSFTSLDRYRLAINCFRLFSIEFDWLHYIILLFCRTNFAVVTRSKALRHITATRCCYCYSGLRLGHAKTCETERNNKLVAVQQHRQKKTTGNSTQLDLQLT